MSRTPARAEDDERLIRLFREQAAAVGARVAQQMSGMKRSTFYVYSSGDAWKEITRQNREKIVAFLKARGALPATWQIGDPIPEPLVESGPVASGRIPEALIDEVERDATFEGERVHLLRAVAYTQLLEDLLLEGRYRRDELRSFAVRSMERHRFLAHEEEFVLQWLDLACSKYEQKHERETGTGRPRN